MNRNTWNYILQCEHIYSDELSWNESRSSMTNFGGLARVFILHWMAAMKFDTAGSRHLKTCIQIFYIGENEKPLVLWFIFPYSSSAPVNLSSLLAQYVKICMEFSHLEKNMWIYSKGVSSDVDMFLSEVWNAGILCTREFVSVGWNRMHHWRK